MTVFYEVSFALLWAIVIVEAIVLQQILWRTVRIRRLHLNSRKATGLSIGDRAPQFTGRVLGTDQFLRSSELRGHTTALLFVSPDEASSRLYANLSVAIHAMWHSTEGNLYVVCSGGEDACRRIIRDHGVDGFKDHEVPLVLDESGEIARRFFITSTPQGVRLDESLRIVRYGRPSPAEEPQHAETGGTAALA